MISEGGLCQVDGAVCGTWWEADGAIHNNQLDLQECGQFSAIRTGQHIGSLPS